MDDLGKPRATRYHHRKALLVRELGRRKECRDRLISVASDRFDRVRHGSCVNSHIERSLSKFIGSRHSRQSGAIKWDEGRLAMVAPQSNDTQREGQAQSATRSISIAKQFLIRHVGTQ